MADALLTRAEAATRLRMSPRTLGRVIARIGEFAGRRMRTLTEAEIDLIRERDQKPGGWKDPRVEPLPPRKSLADTAHLPLLSLDEVMAKAIPMPKRRCGIYFLILKGRITYVGQSVNIVARVGAHGAAKRFDSWSWVPCAKDELLAMERHYIAALKPTRNKDWTTRRSRLKGVRSTPDARWLPAAEAAHHVEMETPDALA